ncbi:MAG: hypothetical protein ACYCSF_02980 [Acidimicrobiales bacterium]
MSRTLIAGRLAPWAGVLTIGPRACPLSTTAYRARIAVVPRSWASRVMAPGTTVSTRF